jgi:hypothetical protein
MVGNRSDLNIAVNLQGRSQLIYDLPRSCGSRRNDIEQISRDRSHIQQNESGNQTRPGPRTIGYVVPTQPQQFRLNSLNDSMPAVLFHDEGPRSGFSCKQTALSHVPL